MNSSEKLNAESSKVFQGSAPKPAGMLLGGLHPQITSWFFLASLALTLFWFGGGGKITHTLGKRKIWKISSQIKSFFQD